MKNEAKDSEKQIKGMNDKIASLEDEIHVCILLIKSYSFVNNIFLCFIGPQSYKLRKNSISSQMGRCAIGSAKNFNQK